MNILNNLSNVIHDGKIYKCPRSTKPSFSDAPLPDDIIQLSKTQKFIKTLYSNYKTSQIKVNGESYTKFIDSQDGTNSAFWCQNNKTGELFYSKYANTEKQKEHLKSEYTASKLYNLAGIKTPQMQLCKLEDNQLCLLSKYESNLTPIRNSNIASIGFGADAWLANWDSLIDGNTMLQNNEIIKIDNGGSLKYRAMGELKPNFGDKVEELITLVDGKNYTSSYIYGDMSHKQLISSLERVANISDTAIRSVVYDDELSNTLVNRKNYIAKVLEKIKTTPMDNKNIHEYLTEVIKDIETEQVSKPTYIDEFISMTESKEDNNYQDIIDDMIKQREQITSWFREKYNNNLNRYLDNIRECYLGQNQYIRKQIAESLGIENIYRACSEDNDNLSELDDLISQNKIPRKTVLYRHAGPYDWGIQDMNSHTFLDRFFIKNKIFRIPIYPETSLDKKVIENFVKKDNTGIIFKYNIPKGINGIYLDNLDSEQSDFDNEKEILLPRNLIGKFKNRKCINGQEIVEIDILEKEPILSKIHEFWKETKENPQREIWNW